MKRLSQSVFCTGLLALSLILSQKVSHAQTVYSTLTSYETAIVGLGSKNLVNFDELNASPNNGTIVGRPVFNGDFYKVSNGVAFASPSGASLFIAPAGSSRPDSTVWNLSNSLSVGRFPFDPALGDDQDSLNVRFNSLQCAVGFTLVNATTQTAEFYDVNNTLILTVSAPTDYAFNRKYYGVVSKVQLIAYVKIIDNVANNDITYDDFEFVPSGTPNGSSVPEPGFAGLLIGSLVVMSGWALRRNGLRGHRSKVSNESI